MLYALTQMNLFSKSESVTIIEKLSLIHIDKNVC